MDLIEGHGHEIRVPVYRVREEAVDGDFRIGQGVRDMGLILFEPRFVHHLYTSILA
jgi:hypothetical protein